MKIRFFTTLISVMLIIGLAGLAGCASEKAVNLASPGAQDESEVGIPAPENAPESEAGEEGAPPLFSAFLPDEFMAVLRGHELPADDNPLLGTYETGSGCIMILLPTGMYIWQENQDVPVVTGIYEIFQGTVGLSGENRDEFALESETGPLFTVIITFTDEHAALDGTIQVFDFYKEGVFRVTDLINDFWFEATRIDN